MKIQNEDNTAVVRQGTVIFIRRLILSWLTAAGVEYLLSAGDLAQLETLARMSPVRMAAMAALTFGVLWVFGYRLKTVERWWLVGALVLCAGSLLYSFSGAYLVAWALILTFGVVYARMGWLSATDEPVWGQGEKRLFNWLAIAIGVAFFLFVSIWTVCRVFVFSVPTFDFTIFAQMFHSMKETGLPVTTVERDGPLSHFAVHVSPIYYLLLPFYCLAPYPATLQVLQAAVLASALIPLWKLGRHHGLAPWQRCVLCLVLALYPAYSGGASFDIHENAFLTPLILWLFYGLDRRNIPMTAVFGLLTCMVKEDAAVYVAVIALWQLLRGLLRRDCRWNLLVGCGLLAGSVVWFLGVTGYLANSGDGVMTNRYENFMYDGSDSLLTVIKAVLMCPMKAVYESAHPLKVEFLCQTLLSLLGLPLLTRRYERYILLIPYILVNLMSDYLFQYSIFFQYTYGSAACLMYLTVVNLAEMKVDRRMLLGLMAAICVLYFGIWVVPKAEKYPRYSLTQGEQFVSRWEFLSQIPEDASVAASRYYTAPFANREVLYDVEFSSMEHVLECEYVVLGLTDPISYRAYGDVEKYIAFLEENGYALQDQLGEIVAIYRRG